MKIKDIIKNVDKSVKSRYISLENIAAEFGIYEYLSPDDGRIQDYFYASWLCTDTYVGGKVYFLDDEPICISWQSARKTDEEFEWISKEAYQKTHQYLLSLIDNEVPEPTLVDLEDDLGNGYHVEYSGQFLTNEVIYTPTGELVTIVHRFKENTVSRNLRVKFENGEEKTVTTADVLCPFALT